MHSLQSIIYPILTLNFNGINYLELIFQNIDLIFVSEKDGTNSLIQYFMLLKEFIWLEIRNSSILFTDEGMENNFFPIKNWMMVSSTNFKIFIR